MARWRDTELWHGECMDGEVVRSLSSSDVRSATCDASMRAAER